MHGKSGYTGRGEEVGFKCSAVVQYARKQEMKEHAKALSQLTYLLRLYYEPVWCDAQMRHGAAELPQLDRAGVDKTHFAYLLSYTLLDKG
jgi:hypothetical protein